MVFKLKPLELSFDFEDRSYELGDTIDVRVNLTASGDVDVREARIDLVCEERFSQHESGVVMGLSGRAGIAGQKMRVTTDYVSASSWVSQRTESYIHSSAVFINDARIRSGHPSIHIAKVQIQPKPPTHLDEAKDSQRDSRSSRTFKWTRSVGQRRSWPRPEEAAKGQGEAAGFDKGAGRCQGAHIQAKEEDGVFVLRIALALYGVQLSTRRASTGRGIPGPFRVFRRRIVAHTGQKGCNQWSKRGAREIARNPCVMRCRFGRSGRIRTRDLRFWRPLL